MDVVFTRCLEPLITKEFNRRSIEKGCFFTYYDKDHQAHDSGLSFVTKNGFSRINSGVCYFTCNDAAKTFINAWDSVTKQILQLGSPLSSEFMGEDQDALVLVYATLLKSQAMTFDNRIDFSQVACFENGISMSGIPCRFWNEPESIGSDISNTHVIHFKGGWQGILEQTLKETNFDFIHWPPGRSKEASLAQLIIWQKHRNVFELE